MKLITEHMQAPARWLLALGAFVSLLAGALCMPAQALPQAPQAPPAAAATPPVELPPAELAMPPYDGLPKGFMIIQGDIIVPTDFYTRRALSPEGTWNTRFWPNGKVPYVFDSNVSSSNQQVMKYAMALWEQTAEIDFFPRGSESNYIYIYSSNENRSAVGMQGGPQYIYIYNWDNQFIIGHELGHTLGLFHEHARPNRDTYVRIEWDCIKYEWQSYFDIDAATADQYPRDGYDFDSVMHYPQTGDFFTEATGYCATIQRAITVLSPNEEWQTKIGQRDHFSAIDQYTMMFLYPKADWRFVDLGYTGNQENGSFLYPYKQFPTGFVNTPNGGTLWVQPGIYSAIGTYNQAVTIKAPLGGVVLH